jgi:SAM-dependent methyltransferase
VTHDHQKVYHRAWSQLGPPLRPPADVVAAIREQIKGKVGRALLLGVTPELADVAPDLVAVDRNFSMAANVWPGNTASRCAVVGDWRQPSFAAGAFSICIADGALSFLTFPDETAGLFRELARILRKDGRAVFRLYVAPDAAETIPALRDEALAGRIDNFHALKLRLAMSLAGQQSVPHIYVANILAAFNSLFPDREELVGATRWSREQIDTIDYYRNSSVFFSFPTQGRLLSVVSKICPDVRLASSGAYEMSERCPLLIVDMP